MVGSARTSMAVVWGTLCVLVLAPPLLLAWALPMPASVVYLGFSCLCHQLPERSFSLGPFPFAVCHRCLGIYLGLLLGSMIAPDWMTGSIRRRRFILTAALIPTLLEVALGRLGLWTGTPFSRLVCGAFLGYLIAPLPVRTLSEACSMLRAGAPSFHFLHTKGDCS